MYGMPLYPATKISMASSSSSSHSSSSSSQDFNGLFIVVFSLVIILITRFLWPLLHRLLTLHRPLLTRVHPHHKISMTSSSASSSRSRKYDVFLSFRGEDTRRTFVDHLHSNLEEHLVHVYKDDKALPRGESISESLFEAIEESQIAVIIFSKNYADSSWCLEELAHIMKCRNERELIVIPIFYDVEPTDVRNQKNKFGEAFSRQATNNVAKAEIWRKALVDVSNIAGWELKNVADGHESQFIKKIVDTILDKLFVSNSCFDEDLVGMRARFQELESLLDIDSSGVRMIGIWGVGGSGKTTLATSACMEISQNYQGHCIVENVREKTNKDGLKKLQENILSSIFKKKVEVDCVVEGKHMMKKMLCRRKVLLLLDDVDTLGQLEALAGNRNWFGSGSRVIITTRDEHLLKAHKVMHVHHVTLLSKDEAIQLFKRHAYNEEEPLEDYEILSLRVVHYASGLPLALKVLGSFLYDKNKDEWISALDKLKDVPNLEVMDILKISYDGLDTYEKELFLDIACFWRFESPDKAMEILEACGYHPEIGIKVLRQKALITIVYKEFSGEVFDMHDLVQEMGHYIVRGKYPKSPEKHSRVWISEEIEEMCFRDASMKNNKIEAINCGDGVFLSSHFCKIVSKMKKLRWLRVLLYDDKYDEGPTFLSNELLYLDWCVYLSRSSFPDNFQPTKLVVLKLSDSNQNELWNGCKRLLTLKVLELRNMKELLNTPDFNGLPCLQKLTLKYCDELQEIHPSFGNHRNLEDVSILYCPKLRKFPTIVEMKNLKTLIISYCDLKDGVIGSGIGELFNLQELDLSRNNFSRLDFSISQLTHLKVLNLSWCTNLLELPELPSSLVILIAMNCSSLTTMGDCLNCKWLCLVSLAHSKVVNGGGRLLKSMLEGNAVENGSMFLAYPGLEIARTFTPRLLRGSRHTLQLPKTSWCDDFSGFLICAVSTVYTTYGESVPTYMELVSSYTDSEDSASWGESDGHSKKPIGLDFEDVASWEQSDCDRHMTWVWYVSFDSLKHTAWWDQIQTYKYLQINLEDPRYEYHGFAVRVMAKKSGSGLTETSKNSYTKYTPNIQIEHDSCDTLKFRSTGFYYESDIPVTTSESVILNGGYSSMKEYYYKNLL